MSTITSERLLNIQQWRETYGPGSNVVLPAEEAEELARIALASLEAEGKLSNFVASQESLGEDFEKVLAENIEGLYVPGNSAPPAPVSDEDLLQMAASAIDDLLSNKDRSGAGVWADIPAKLRRAAMLQGADGNAPVVPDWQAKAEKMSEIHGTSFVVFRNGESPKCADPSKVIISFTDEGLGHGAAAPQQEAKNV
ncbi:DUF551 domain-containing protein [Citrobacter freundii]|uniref:DUF551 domain-containing protein n=1 Tax=Citrobacter freundii TaxID=546 RepID=UPI0023AE8CD6|nr:DUF551 domain-containing protein [Citrobacter freundii]